ncbi:MAG TPA: PQQ-binding-like beta-propeller repeat protein, partial [Elusimicrobiales bacterium]|nr:PQQ-binding-like beta-propeller repeat protein [Elusimicrobiales bacterium]
MLLSGFDDLLVILEDPEGMAAEAAVFPVEEDGDALELLLGDGLLAGFSAQAADWPMFRGNPQRTGFSPEQAYPPLTKVWEYQTGAEIVSSPAVLEDAVYFGSRDGGIYALNARTGALIWRYAADGWVDASPAVSGDSVFCPSMDGYLYRLDRATGALIWKAQLGASSVSSPLVYEGKVAVGTGSPENKLKVLEVSSGRTLSERQAAQPVDSAPSLEGDIVYFGANDGTVYAFNKDTFSPAWAEYQTMGGRYGMNAVAVSSGIVYALPGYDENKPLALSATGGLLLNPQSAAFEESDSWELLGSPAVSGDRVYFPGGASVNTLYAMDKVPAGQALPYVWPSSPALGGVSGIGVLSSPAMVNDLIYVGSLDGYLAAFSSGAAAVPLTADVSFSTAVYSSPAVSNGMVFVGTAGGKLAAYSAARTAAIS